MTVADAEKPDSDVLAFNWLGCDTVIEKRICCSVEIV